MFLLGLIDDTSASSMVLGILLGIMTLWFIFENFVYERFVCYVFAHYFVFVLAFSGIVNKLQNLPEASRQNMILASINLALACLFFIAKIGLFVYRYYCRKK